jgi:hypothetical protein
MLIRSKVIRQTLFKTGLVDKTLKMFANDDLLCPILFIHLLAGVILSSIYK